MAPLALLLGAGCVGDDPPKDDMAMGADLATTPPRDMTRPADDMAVRADLAGAADLAVAHDLAGAADMATTADLSTATPDLSTPAGDMATGPVVTGLPTCTVTGVNADMVFTDVARGSCASGMCHNMGSAGLTFTTGATFKSALVGVTSKQVATLALVTASNIDKSYLMYKLTGQHTALGGRGDLMPKGGMRLSDANLCKFIVWIKEGAK